MPPKTPPASADMPEARQPADESFEFARYLAEPGVTGQPAHVLAGAAALHGWAPGTKLTKADLREGVKAFLSAPARREE